MKLSDIFESSRSFGIGGVRKDDLNQFLTQTILDTMDGMSSPPSSKRWVLSMSKRLTGTAIPNLFHIRNVVNGKKKYLNRKLMQYMAPMVGSAVKATINDHPELEDSEVNSEEYIVNFINALVDKHHEFKRIIS